MPDLPALTDLLRRHAAEQPERLACAFTPDGEVLTESLTYGALDRAARAVAAHLREQMPGSAGGRALLLYPPGTAYLVGIFGALYAGMVAVPVPLPEPGHLQRNLLCLGSILRDVQPAAVLTTTGHRAQAATLYTDLPALLALPWVATDSLPPAGQPDAAGLAAPPEPAFLLYTSGTVAEPSGVMLTQRSLVQQAAYTNARRRVTAESIFGFWLPGTHTAWLAMALSQPLQAGCPCYWMPPAAFAADPLRWLHLISRFRVTVSGGPPFGYEQCSRQALAADGKGDELAGLDLSCWHTAVVGGEPVGPEMFERFATAFRPYGFDGQALSPAYGMTECSGAVSWARPDAPLLVLMLDGRALSRGGIVPSSGAEATSLVSVGPPLDGLSVAIVDPDSDQICPQDRVGEIWLAGEGVAAGYWGKADKTEEVFGAALTAGDPVRYLRTGDLGFLCEGELFISGRLKDMLRLRGLNFYAQDIEGVVQGSHPALRAGGCAAFSVEGDDGERLVIAQEVDDALTPLDPRAAQIIRAVRGAVGEQLEIPVYTIVLARPGTLARAAMGKPLRQHIRAAFLTGTLPAVATWTRDLAGQGADSERAMRKQMARQGRWRGCSVRCWSGKRWGSTTTFSSWAGIPWPSCSFAWPSRSTWGSGWHWTGPCRPPRRHRSLACSKRTILHRPRTPGARLRPPDGPGGKWCAGHVCSSRNMPRQVPISVSGYCPMGSGPASCAGSAAGPGRKGAITAGRRLWCASAWR